MRAVPRAARGTPYSHRASRRGGEPGLSPPGRAIDSVRSRRVAGAVRRHLSRASGRWCGAEAAAWRASGMRRRRRSVAGGAYRSGGKRSQSGRSRWGLSGSGSRWVDSCSAAGARLDRCPFGVGGGALGVPDSGYSAGASGDTDKALRGAKQASREAADSSWVEGLARYGLVAKGSRTGSSGALAAALALAGDGKARAAKVRSSSSHRRACTASRFSSRSRSALSPTRCGGSCRRSSTATGKARTRTPSGSGPASPVARSSISPWRSRRCSCSTARAAERRRRGAVGHGARAEYPAGRWLVGLVGLAFVGAALFNAYRGFTQKFEENWNVGECPQSSVPGFPV